MHAAPKPLSRAAANRGNLPRFRSVEATSAQIPRQRHLVRQVRALRRTLWIALFLPFAIALQTLLVRLPGPQKSQFAQFFWHAVAVMLGLRVRLLGTPAGGPARTTQRPVIYVCNHSSWLDIPAIGGQLQGRFVAKDDVAAWPVISTIARLGRTVYVSRNRAGTLRERDEMQQALLDGDDLILFPEGTSSDGSRVLPFRSPFFAAAYCEAKPLIQPVSVVFDRLAGLPVTHASRTVFAWYGDMSLAPHFWQVAQWRGKRVSLLFHPPLDPADFANRKALAQATWEVVADGAAALRQNRPARVAVPVALPAGSTEPAFA